MCLFQAGTPDMTLDDRKQKHVSFDSSSLLRSATLGTVDEATYNRIGVGVGLVDQASLSASSERLIDSGRKTPDFEYLSQVFPPDVARQLIQDRLKKSSMRSMATQTDVNRQQRPQSAIYNHGIGDEGFQLPDSTRVMTS